jgi:hypothetical protein
MAIGVTGASATGVLDLPKAWATSGPSSYTAAWSSVNQRPPAPEWFQDAKFGIYYHWGIFSVPAFGNEWYPRTMYIGTSAENQLWYSKLQEVIDGYQPDTVWQDFDLGLAQESQRLNFLAHYFNQAVARNEDAVATYKDGLNDHRRRQQSLRNR